MQRLSVNGAEFEYETVGSGEPLVLIHGSVSGETDHCLLDEETLTDRYQVTLYHRRGFLGSSRHAGPFGIVDQARDARAFIEAVVGGPAHVSGHSYGGATLLQLAFDAPELVHTVSLREPPLPVPGAEEFIGRAAAVQAVYEAGRHGEAIDAFLDIALGPGEYKASMAANMPDGWFDRAVADIDTLFQVEFPALGEWEFTKEMASRITQPVLSVVGAISHPFFFEGDELIHEWMPQAETFVLPNASHGLQYMNPRGMADGLVAFLEKHPIRVPTTA